MLLVLLVLLVLQLFPGSVILLVLGVDINIIVINIVIVVVDMFVDNGALEVWVLVRDSVASTKRTTA
jgi:hypothetical protein